MEYKQDFWPDLNDQNRENQEKFDGKYSHDDPPQDMHDEDIQNEEKTFQDHLQEVQMQFDDWLSAPQKNQYIPDTELLDFLFDNINEENDLIQTKMWIDCIINQCISFLTNENYLIIFRLINFAMNNSIQFDELSVIEYIGLNIEFLLDDNSPLLLFKIGIKLIDKNIYQMNESIFQPLSALLEQSFWLLKMSYPLLEHLFLSRIELFNQDLVLYFLNLTFALIDSCKFQYLNTVRCVLEKTDDETIIQTIIDYTEDLSSQMSDLLPTMDELNQEYFRMFAVYLVDELDIHNGFTDFVLNQKE